MTTKHMVCNFHLDQMAFLKTQTRDISVSGYGVCAGMVSSWIQHELSEKPQSFLFYKNTYNFISRQRALACKYLISKKLNLAFSSDLFYPIRQVDLKTNDFQSFARSTIRGVFSIVIYSKNGYSHCIGMSINKGNYKIFDPNLGEFQITKSRSFSSFIFQDWISRKYPPSRTPYLQITQYKSKHLNITTSTAPHIAD